jgi:DNA-binding transcriptional regulator GbsR (MarR family)
LTEILETLMWLFVPVKNKREPGLSLGPETENFIQRMGQLYESLGITNISGKIMGLLLVWGEPVSPEQISSLLGVSRSSISTNLKILKLYGYLEERKLSGVRNKFFIFSESAWKNSIRVKLNAYDPFQAIVEDGIRILSKKGKSTLHMEEIISFMEVEKEFYKKALRDWDIITKKNKKKDKL